MIGALKSCGCLRAARLPTFVVASGDSDEPRLGCRYDNRYASRSLARLREFFCGAAVPPQLRVGLRFGPSCALRFGSRDCDNTQHFLGSVVA